MADGYLPLESHLISVNVHAEANAQLTFHTGSSENETKAHVSNPQSPADSTETLLFVLGCYNKYTQFWTDHVDTHTHTFG